MLDFLRKRPIVISLMSLDVASSREITLEHVVMVRNFGIRKTLPFRPMRSDQNSPGPEEVSRTAIRTSKRSDARPSKAKNDIVTSIRRLIRG